MVVIAVELVAFTRGRDWGELEGIGMTILLANVDWNDRKLRSLPMTTVME